MRLRSHERGITLIVALVMLVVLTLVVVSAIRFGNLSIGIARNTQSEVEGTAAVQYAIESKVQEIANPSTNISGMAVTTMSVSTGGGTYSVTVQKPACILTKNIKTTDLNPASTADRPCFEGTDPDRQEDSSGNLTSAPTACKDQQWDIAASLVGDGNGTQISMLQGISVRVGAEVSCSD
jgi:Tfp pilus assembly protein PilX